MFRKISKLLDHSGALAKGDERSAATTQGRINGLLVVADSVGTVSNLALTVTLDHGTGSTKYLCNTVPMRALAGLHDLMRGAAPKAGDTGPVSFYVDVGQLLPAGDDEVRVTVMATAALLAGASLRIMTVEGAQTYDSEFFLSYERIDNDPTISRDDVLLLAAYRIAADADPRTVTADEVSYLVKTGDRESERALRDCAHLTYCLARTEGSPPSIAVVHGDPLGEEPAIGVCVQRNGTKASEWGYLVVRRDVIPGRVYSKAVELAARRAQVVEHAEAKQPERVAALRTLTKLPDSKALRLGVVSLRK